MADFNIIIPLKKDINSNQLTGIASTTSVDKDDEKMSADALHSMVKDIKTQGVNLFGNHEHNWENTLGVINTAELVNNQVQVGITLDDASTNPKIPMLLNKLKKGIKLGLSVGGNVTGYKWEYDRTVGKKIKVLDQVKIYEVSVVGIPSNSDSFLSIPAAIAKSAKVPGILSPICPLCYSEIKNGVCSVCLTQN
jgi:HK97 family phage prohead protease